MKVICVMVSSVDGKITKENSSDIHEWTSVEDGKYFSDLIQKHELIVMGRTTYESGVKPDDKRLRIIMTSSPEKFKEEAIPGHLEFSSEDPKTLVDRLEKAGNAEMLLVGGMETNTTFFKAGLITDLWLTIEPKIIGIGKMVISPKETYMINLQLESFEMINEKGSLLLKYKVTR